MSKMKRLTIPMGDNVKNNLVLQALITLHAALGGVDEENDEVGYMRHDLLGLQGVFGGKYKVMIEITQDDFDGFVGNHGVDYPAWSNMEIVDVEEIEEIKEEQSTREPQLFQHLAYVEDGKLTLAVRSDKPFPLCDDEGADPSDENSTRYHRYTESEPGKGIILEGTTFAAVPTSIGWSIIEDGESIEDIEI
jgi:hypothetical protein